MAERSISLYWLAQAEQVAQQSSKPASDLPSRSELAAWAGLPIEEQRRLEVKHYGRVLTEEPNLSTRAARVAAKVVGQKRGPKQKRRQEDQPMPTLPSTVPGYLTDDELAELLAQTEQAALAREAERTADDRPKLDYNVLSVAQLEQLGACRSQVAGPPADDVAGLVQHEAERNLTERRIGQLDGALQMAQSRLREHEYELQRAHSQAQNVRNRLHEHGHRLAADERQVARARQALEQAEARVQATIQEAAEAHQRLAALLDVPEEGVDQALAEIDQQAMGELVRVIEPAPEATRPAYPLPARSVYGHPAGDQHFDAQGRRVTAQGEPLERH
jgi:hypothetical protein